MNMELSEYSNLLIHMMNNPDIREIREFLIDTKAELDKGNITVDELAGFAEGMIKSQPIKITSKFEVTDTCGTGGDCKNTVNISTAAAIVASAAGVRIAKHGNYSVSSSSGSANVLEELGYNIHMNPEQCLRMLDIGFAFLPAQVFYPSMARIAPLRKEIGKTIFNVIGPMANPANAASQIVGVYDERLCMKVCHALRKLGKKRALVVNSKGMDEISNIGNTSICELDGKNIRQYSVTPEQFGYERRSLKELKVYSPQESAAKIRKAFNTRGNAITDAIAMNAGAAIYVATPNISLEQAVESAEDTIYSGAAAEKLFTVAKYSRSI